MIQFPWHCRLLFFHTILASSTNPLLRYRANKLYICINILLLVLCTVIKKHGFHHLFMQVVFLKK